MLEPDHLAIGFRGLLPDGPEDWRPYASDAGYLRIRPRVRFGPIGICGELALGVPPAEKDVDAWEASKPAGHWDYWGFIDFMTVPTSTEEAVETILYFRPGNLLSAPVRVVSRLRMPAPGDECLHLPGEEADEALLRASWDQLRNAMLEKFGAADLGKQRWTVGKTVFDATAPDA